MISDVTALTGTCFAECADVKNILCIFSFKKLFVLRHHKKKSEECFLVLKTELGARSSNSVSMSIPFQ
jgi:hypothetical protein